jgi:hypothetical protein
VRLMLSPLVCGVRKENIMSQLEVLALTQEHKLSQTLKKTILGEQIWGDTI